MNKKLLLLYITIFSFFSDFALYAQPGDDDGGGGLEGGDPAPAPINSKIILLFIAGLLFAFYTFKRNRKEA
jgi:hypothetical protein